MKKKIFTFDNWLMVFCICFLVLSVLHEISFKPRIDLSISINNSFPEKCLTKYCENVSVRVPGTNLTCNNALFMKEGTMYCNIGDLN